MNAPAYVSDRDSNDRATFRPSHPEPAARARADTRAHGSVGSAATAGQIHSVCISANVEDAINAVVARAHVHELADTARRRLVGADNVTGAVRIARAPVYGALVSACGGGSMATIMAAPARSAQVLDSVAGVTVRHRLHTQCCWGSKGYGSSVSVRVRCDGEAASLCGDVPTKFGGRSILGETARVSRRQHARTQRR